MSRSKWKIPYIDNFLLKQVFEKKISKPIKKRSGLVKTYSRSSVINSDFVGLKIKIHNGKEFKPILISSDMIGHKLGEFVFTRARYEFKKKKKKKK
jgi:small subunit ribosomal protein S19